MLAQTLKSLRHFVLADESIKCTGDAMAAINQFLFNGWLEHQCIPTDKTAFEIYKQLSF